MKKILLAGALAASMLASSAAFAADLTVGYSEDKLYVTADTDAAMTANAGKQMTVVVVDGDGTTVSTDTIRYIDQDAAAAGLFESMGVLLREGEKELPVGTYTVKIGGEGITDLYVGTFEIKEDVPTPSGKKITFVYGDVNASGAADETDAADLLSYVAGYGALVGDSTIEIDTKFVDINDAREIVYGDVNASGAADETDAADILSFVAGYGALVGDSTIEIDSTVEMTVAE